MTKLALFITLALLYFATDTGLSWWFRRRFSQDDNYIGKNAPDEAQRFFGRAIYLTLVYYLLVFIYLATGFDFWRLISNVTILDNLVFEMMGFALGLIFLLLMVLVRLDMGRSWWVGLDRDSTDGLVTTGFYGLVRNPYFAFFLGFQIALFLVAPNAIMLCAWVQSAILLGLQVRLEESFLEEKYGDRYLTYKQTTGRFLPNLSIQR